MKVLQRNKHISSWDLAILCPVLDPEDTKVLKDTCTPAITATLGTVAKARSNPSVKGQMNGQRNGVHRHNAILLSHQDG